MTSARLQSALTDPSHAVAAPRITIANVGFYVGCRSAR